MSDPSKNPLLTWALWYALKRRWPVFPLRPRSKHPLIPKEKGGAGCLDATLNEGVIRRWWTDEPQANIGLATGHGWWALDIDVKHGGDETWDMLRYKYGQLPDTIEQVTGGGGKQILYQWPDFQVKNSEGEIGPGIDTRGFHGYIVAPPSIHPDTGRAYTWDGMDSLADQAIAPAPAWLLDLVRRISLKGASEKAAAPVPNKIPKGMQHRTLVSIAGSMRRRGLTADEIFAALKVTNETRCAEPGPEENIRRIADSVAKYPPDARYNIFRMAARETESEAAVELPLSASDLEAAVDDLIARNDLAGAYSRARDLAKQPREVQIRAKAKFKQKFKEEFSTRDFEELLKLHSEGAPASEPLSPAEEAAAVNGAAGPDLINGIPLTDSGNGERIVLLFGNEIRYCVEMDKWLVWDGRRWAIDEYQLVTQKAKQMARLLYAQAALVQNPDVRKAVEKFARQSESQGSITAALKRAATEKHIPISAARLDQHAYLLNCANGVIDLRTGDLLPHNSEYLITKICHVTFDLTAKCPRFLKFMDWAMGQQNPEAELSEKTVRMTAFVQRAIGYSLTADVSAKALFVLLGEKGNNGKTTLLTILKELLAEYSAQIAIDVLLAMKLSDSAAKADLADLRGARVVTTSEPEEGDKLNEGKVKYLTAGMGKIKTCRKYENPIEFTATHKLFMEANYRPQIRGADPAIWSRIKCIRFDQRIEEDHEDFDPKLIEKLRAELPGILAWAVRGCIAWVKEGLGEPPELKEANLDWQHKDDPLKEFLEDCCEINLQTAGQPDGLYVKAKSLSKAYELWCRDNGGRNGIAHGRFTSRMQAKGFKPNNARRVEGKQTRTWEGLRLREEVESALRNEGKNWKGTLLED